MREKGKERKMQGGDLEGVVRELLRELAEGEEREVDLFRRRARGEEPWDELVYLIAASSRARRVAAR